MYIIQTSLYTTPNKFLLCIPPSLKGLGLGWFTQLPPYSLLFCQSSGQVGHMNCDSQPYHLTSFALVNT